MNQFTQLTGDRKIMNIVKLGIVSASANRSVETTKPNSGGALKATTYTLCVKRTNPSRYGWRYSFAFYIPLISRPDAPGHLVQDAVGLTASTRCARVCSVCIRGLRFTSSALKNYSDFTASEENRAEVVAPPEAPVYRSPFVPSATLEALSVLACIDSECLAKLFHLVAIPPSKPRKPRRYWVWSGFNLSSIQNRFADTVPTFEELRCRNVPQRSEERTGRLGAFACEIGGRHD
jgi:hypothetical protein